MVKICQSVIVVGQQRLQLSKSNQNLALVTVIFWVKLIHSQGLFTLTTIYLFILGLLYLFIC